MRENIRINPSDQSIYRVSDSNLRGSIIIMINIFKIRERVLSSKKSASVMPVIRFIQRIVSLFIMIVKRGTVPSISVERFKLVCNKQRISMSYR
jgi:hypothetical protein